MRWLKTIRDDSSFVLIYDSTTSEGVKLINNVIQNFKTPLIGTLSLNSDDAAKLIRAIRDPGS